MLPAEIKNILEVIHVGGEVLGEDQDIIHVDETEGKFTQNKVNHALKVFPAFRSTKDILKNSNIPKGVTMAVF